jgi:hypothetical protein
MSRTAQLILVSSAILGLAMTIVAPATARQVEPEQLDTAKLKVILDNMGLEVKVSNTEKGKEHYEVVAKTEKYNIPVDYSLSNSGRYLWLTCSLGENSPTKKHEELLKATAKTQPVHFYITAKNKLMAAVAVENRAVTAAHLRRSADLLVSAVSSNDTVWQ